MSLPSASRPGDESRAMPRCPADSDDARGADDLPAGAASLADLIADSGPLPADAALECLQRLAERLARLPLATGRRLDATHVLIDDDGGVWLRPAADATPSDATEDMQQIGRLLVYLVSGETRHLTEQTAPDTASLPKPISTIASRLFSRNGTGYSSYAEVAADAAAIRDASPVEDDDRSSKAELAAPSANADPSPAETSTDADGSSGFALIVLIACVLAAAIGLAVWRWF